MARSNERIPASMCTTGTRAWAAASAPASVELVSPYTSTASGASSLEQRLERRQHARGLRGVRAAADPQFAVGARKPELAEEDPRERIVVVLAGVHEHLLVAPAAGRTRRRP